MKFTSALIALLLASTVGVLAAPAGTSSREDAAIRKVLDSYVAAYNRGDAHAVAAYMTADAEHSDEQGVVASGRAAIEKRLAGLFAAGGSLKLVVTPRSRRLIRPDVALERGTALVTAPDGAGSGGTYTVVWTKTSGQWRMASIEETGDAPATTHYPQLQELSFLIGTWVDQDKNATIRTVGAWSANHNFITRQFSVKVDNRVQLAGTQIIGWDAAAERIRSWVFDSEGGFSQETWKKDGDRWVITSAGVLADGRRASALNILRRVDDEHLSWQSTEREVDGELQPSIRPVIVVRATAGR